MRLRCLVFAALLVLAALGQPARPAPVPPKQASSKPQSPSLARPAAPGPPQQPSLQVQTPSYDDLIAKALSLLAEKKAKEAVAVSEQAIALDEKRWEAYATAASAYSAQQLYDDTISMLQMALGRAPEEKKQAVRDAITAARRQVAQQAAPKPAEPAVARPDTGPAQPTTLQAEAALWKTIENSTRPEDYKAYLSTYPDGTFAPVAKARLEAITSKLAKEGAEQQKMRNSNLGGAGWQGTVETTQVTLKFAGDDKCRAIIVGTTATNAYSCRWEKIGEALYVHVDAGYCNGWGADWVLALEGESASGLMKSRERKCQDLKISLKRSE